IPLEKKNDIPTGTEGATTQPSNTMNYSNIKNSDIKTSLESNYQSPGDSVGNSTIQTNRNENDGSKNTENDSNNTSLPLDPGPPVTDQSGILSFKEIMLVFIGLLCAIFLASLDQTIVSVCIPRIANEFNS